jgi:NitT/TauT family transport system substrate-binding protein
MRPTRSGARAWRAAPIAMSLVLLISGCSLFGSGGSGASAGGATITVAVVPGIENAPLDVALQQGFFQQHGLNVSVKSYTSLNDEYQALTGGQVQIAAGDYTDFFYEESLYEQRTGGSKLLHLVADGYDAAANSVAILAVPNQNNGSVITPQQLASQGYTVATAPAQ